MSLRLIYGGVDVAPVLAELARASDLWGEHPERTAPLDSPHRESQDIWLRFRSLDALNEPTKFAEPHWSEWLPPMQRLQSLRPIIFDVMRAVEATHLGGCMLTRIPPGKRIYEHVDGGWHATTMNAKLYVILQANELCVNRCGVDSAVMRAGDVWLFDNSLPHSVVNDGDTDRVAAILTMKVEP